MLILILMNSIFYICSSVISDEYLYSDKIILCHLIIIHVSTIENAEFCH